MCTFDKILEQIISSPTLRALARSYHEYKKYQEEVLRKKGFSVETIKELHKEYMKKKEVYELLKDRIVDELVEGIIEAIVSDIERKEMDINTV